MKREWYISGENVYYCVMVFMALWQVYVVFGFWMKKPRVDFAVWVMVHADINSLSASSDLAAPASLTRLQKPIFEDVKYQEPM